MPCVALKISGWPAEPTPSFPFTHLLLNKSHTFIKINFLTSPPPVTKTQDHPSWVFVVPYIYYEEVEDLLEKKMANHL